MGVADLFDPERVAVVGATDREGSVGRAIVENLLDGFEGEVVLVNPTRETVFGRDCVDDLAATSGVDLAVVAVPPTVAVDVIEAGAAAGVDTYVVVTAGFSEAGSEGAARERRLREVAAAHDLTVVGPNCIGVFSTGRGLNASFSPTAPLPGSVSFMSQSGAFITAVLDWAREQEIGFRDVVSLGNKAVLDETDFVEAWAEDPDTDVVIGYLESIEDGRAFLERTREATRSTPIVLVKAGRTDAGAQAASSHTGAIAGSERAYEAGLEQAGVLRVDTPEALFDYARALSGQPLPERASVGIVTNAGGPGVMATDAVGDADLSLASFEERTVRALESSLPDAANTYNPVDVLGDADADRFRAAMHAVLADAGVGAVAVLAAPTAVLDYDALAAVIAEVQAEHGTPVVACLMGGRRVEAPAAALREVGIPNYFDPARAVASLAALAEYADVREREYEPPREFEDVDRERAAEILRGVRERPANRLGVEAMELLEAYGVPTPASHLARTPREARRAAERIGAPVVMKLVSPDILHKTDIGWVVTGVGLADAADTYETLVSRAHQYQPDATVTGVQVQATADVDAGVETIVGLNRDPQFGPLVLFGLGGIFVEVMEDTAVRVAPVGQREARAMVDEIRAAPLLRGARGREPVDVGAVVETVQRLGQLAVDHPAILELDVNPLLATPEGVRALDLRVTVNQEAL